MDAVNTLATSCFFSKCGARFHASDAVKVGDILTCPSCGRTSEVIDTGRDPSCVEYLRTRSTDDAYYEEHPDAYARLVAAGVREPHGAAFAEALAAVTPILGAPSSVVRLRRAPFSCATCGSDDDPRWTIDDSESLGVILAAYRSGRAVSMDSIDPPDMVASAARAVKRCRAALTSQTAKVA